MGMEEEIFVEITWLEVGEIFWYFWFIFIFEGKYPSSKILANAYCKLSMLANSKICPWQKETFPLLYGCLSTAGCLIPLPRVTSTFKKFPKTNSFQLHKQIN